MGRASRACFAVPGLLASQAASGQELFDLQPVGDGVYVEKVYEDLEAKRY